MRIFQLQNYLDNINNFQIIALEGKCASGKSTIINHLKESKMLWKLKIVFMLELLF